MYTTAIQFFTKFRTMLPDGVFTPPPHNNLIIKILQRRLFLAFLFILSLGILPLQGQTSSTLYNAVYYYVGNPPDVFMNESNLQIINRLKELNCNAVFLFWKVSQANANFANLGLYEYPSNAVFQGYSGQFCYRDKLTDFIDLASRQTVPIKVFALQIETDRFLEPGWTTAQTILDKISYYQQNVQTLFPGKKALLNGIVTNVEPWDINSSNPLYVNGSPYYWKNSFCSAGNRVNNNLIMNRYLEFAGFIKNILLTNGFLSFNPPYPIDNKVLGTTHWYMHYYSQKYSADFPAGNFSQLVSSGRFDYIIPQTYCSQSDLTCQNAACINPELTSFCEGNYSDDSEAPEGDIPYDESTGKCLGWFEKHMLGNEMYSGFSAYTLPIDAAPLLFGHSAWMASTRAALKEFRDNVRYLSRVCYSKDNYRGSVIFNYAQAFELPAGIPQAGVPICNNVPPDEGGLSENERIISVHPNPATTTLYLEGCQSTDQISLKNLLSGYTIQMQALPTFDVSGLPVGWYLLVISDAQGHQIYHDKIYIQ